MASEPALTEKERRYFMQVPVRVYLDFDWRIQAGWLMAIGVRDEELFHCLRIFEKEFDIIKTIG